MNSKKLLNSEFGLSHQGSGLSQQFDHEIIIFDAFLEAKGGGGGNKPDKPGTGGGEPTPTSVYVSGDSAIDDLLEFNVRIEFLGDEWLGQESLKDDFINAANFLSALIQNDIAPDGYDDITISASLVNIDGSGGVLGRAGPTSYWTANTLSSAAVMEFDIADAADFESLGLWDDIVLHEMLHSIGFGTLWSYQGLVDTVVIDDNGTKRPIDDIVSSVFTGENATYFSDLIFDEPQALVETDGGSGTAGGHWDEETYLAELMTGYINFSNTLSDMSYGALEDMGYVIDYAVVPTDYFLV